MASTLHFLRQYTRPRRDAIAVEDLVYDRLGEPLPATFYRRAGRRGPLPTWIVLHGLTYRGRRHASLDRFARAVAAAGPAVLVPEIPEWSRLAVAPAVTGPSIGAAVDFLRRERLADPSRIGVLGFSFGATQALAALGDPALGEKVKALVAWGGYCDLRNLFLFGFTGEHGIDRLRERLSPDPYGAWIMGANYLTRVPGHDGDLALAAALRELAEQSGRRGVFAGNPVYDPLKAQLREGLPPGQREVFDLFAPPTGRPVDDPERAYWLTGALADAALAADPLLDPRPRLPTLHPRVLVAHGRDDRLVPYTEAIRLGRELPAGRLAGCTITALFAHSGGASHNLGPLGATREAARFVRLLNKILELL